MTNIPSIHAASGCDTVSALSGIGKAKLIKSEIKSVEKRNVMHWQCSTGNSKNKIRFWKVDCL